MASSSHTHADDDRYAACRALEQVIKYDRTIDWVLQEKPRWLATPLAQALVYGSLRHYYSLRTILDAHLTKPLRNKDIDVDCLLLVGAYQLLYTRIPDHAAINETVGACTKLKKPWAKGLLNAVLRELRSHHQGQLSSSDEVDLPTWLIHKIKEQYRDLPDLLRSVHEHPVMTLRINTLRVERASYLRQLNAANIDFSETLLPEAICLSQPQSAETLPLWHDGAIAVQDLGAMLVARLSYCAIASHPITGTTVLDACCAPGGKLFALAQLLDQSTSTQPRPTQARDDQPRFMPPTLVGLDVNSSRLNTTRAIGARLGCNDTVVIEGDATATDWWDGKQYGHILLDAPCSGSGTLRRNPDIKLRLDESSLETHQQTQLKLLNNLWRMLDSNGSLLYCTCSIFQEENDQVIRQFLAQHQSPSEQPSVIAIDLPTGHATEFGWQLLPTDHLTDGFYCSVLSRCPEGLAGGLRL
jgi:16S rRNA (cytosine967-C5)-methyltransferase